MGAGNQTQSPFCEHVALNGSPVPFLTFMFKALLVFFFFFSFLFLSLPLSFNFGFSRQFFSV